MIFPNLELESTLQVNDKTRLSGVKSYVSKDEAAITLVEIEAESGSGFVDVTGAAAPFRASDWFLDWEYATAGVKVVSLRITTDGAPVTITKSITVVTALVDNLFANDNDLVAEENDILKWVRPGRNSHLDTHRKAKDLILKELDRLGIRSSDGSKVIAADLLDVSEVKEWATYLALMLIFKTNSNAVDDVFAKKMDIYSSRIKEVMNRKEFLYDYNRDGTIDFNEFASFQTIDVVRR